MRRLRFTIAVLLVLCPAVGHAQMLEPLDIDKQRQKPISTVGGQVGDLLRQWWKEGTAAGNIGDYYDNRDGDHSPLNLAPFPQLLTVKYSPDDIKLRKNWAAQNVIHSAVVFGNSSTSAPPTQGGSNPRHYYCASRGLSFLAQEYAKNNLYIYPEHRDHDPGHNGKGDGFGDLYPTNTPYLLISQGSSGSDQPFMRAVPLTLAAFRPEVKKKLIDTGTLMPALQMIFRSTNKQLKGPDEYLTGKAHPSVFEGSWVDELAMVKSAHALELKALPPIVRLKVLEEDKAVPGVDFFEDGGTKYLADTPAVIARIHRSKEHKRRLVVSAEGSHDLNQAPLTFKWVVLRGDPQRIQIKPRNQNGSVAAVTVAYHERRPVAPGSPLESNRVDIGVFVHNGTYHSAPAFVTFYTLDNEYRNYQPATGQLLEIAYGMGETDLRVTDWEKVLAVLAKDATAGLLFDLDDARRVAMADVARRYQELGAALRAAEGQVRTAEARAKTADDKDLARKETEAARKKVGEVQNQRTSLLNEPNKALGTSPQSYFEKGCSALTQRTPWTDRHALLAKLRKDATASGKGRIAELSQQLERLDVASFKAPGTAFQRARLEQLALVTLGDCVFPGMLQVTYQPNFVDQRLTAPKTWRDVYRYDKKNECIGWTRFHPERAAEEFNHEGLLIVEKDELGRCKKARTVRYTRTAAKGFPNANPLRMELGDWVVSYEFDGGDDRRGKRAPSEAAK